LLDAEPQSQVARLDPVLPHGPIVRHDHRDLQAALGQGPRQRAGNGGQAPGFRKAFDLGGDEQDTHDCLRIGTAKPLCKLMTIAKSMQAKDAKKA
jgi:hypothetical protein